MGSCFIRPKIVTTNTKVDKREVLREKKALKAAQLDRAIENELLERLRQVSETEIYNYPERQYTKMLTKASDDYNSAEEEEEEENEDEFDVEVSTKQSKKQRRGQEEEEEEEEEEDEDEVELEGGEYDDGEDDDDDDGDLDGNYNVEFVEVQFLIVTLSSQSMDLITAIIVFLNRTLKRVMRRTRMTSKIPTWRSRASTARDRDQQRVATRVVAVAVVVVVEARGRDQIKSGNSMMLRWWQRRVRRARKVHALRSNTRTSKKIPAPCILILCEANNNTLVIISQY